MFVICYCEEARGVGGGVICYVRYPGVCSSSMSARCCPMWVSCYCLSISDVYCWWAFVMVLWALFPRGKTRYFCWSCSLARHKIRSRALPRQSCLLAFIYSVLVALHSYSHFEGSLALNFFTTIIVYLRKLQNPLILVYSWHIKLFLNRCRLPRGLRRRVCRV